jgi:hypothetical protein
VTTSLIAPANKFLILAEEVDVAWWCADDLLSIMMIFFDQIKDNLYIFWHFNNNQLLKWTQHNDMELQYNIYLKHRYYTE